MKQVYEIKLDPVPPRIDGSRKRVLVIFRKGNKSPSDAIALYRARHPNDQSTYLDTVEVSVEEIVIE